MYIIVWKCCNEGLHLDAKLGARQYCETWKHLWACGLLVLEVNLKIELVLLIDLVQTNFDEKKDIRIAWIETYPRRDDAPNIMILLVVLNSQPDSMKRGFYDHNSKTFQEIQKYFTRRFLAYVFVWKKPKFHNFKLLSKI